MLTLIEQTNYCNLQCQNCPNRLRQRPKGYMKPEMFKDIIDQLLERNNEIVNERIALHGVGEPLLSPYLYKNLDYLQKKGFKNVDFSTNGLILNKHIKKLVKYTCISWLRVSLNSTRKELMEKINTGSDFDKVVRNIKFLLDSVKYKRYPFEVVVQIMKTKANEDETVDDAYRLFNRNDFRVIIKQLHTYHGQTELTELSFTDKIPNTCQFGATLDIHWDGDMVGCCADDTKSQVYGHISEGIYSLKVKGRKLQMNAELQSRNFNRLPFCKQCLGF